MGGCRGRGRVWGGGRGEGGYDRRIEVFGKIHKKIGEGGGREGSGGGRVCGRGGGGVRVDMYEELKFL